MAVKDKSVIVADPELNVPVTDSFPPTFRFLNIPTPPATLRAPDVESVDSVVFVIFKTADGSIVTGFPFTSKVPSVPVVIVDIFDRSLVL